MQIKFKKRIFLIERRENKFFAKWDTFNGEGITPELAVKNCYANLEKFHLECSKIAKEYAKLPQKIL